MLSKILRHYNCESTYPDGCFYGQVRGSEGERYARIQLIFLRKNIGVTTHFKGSMPLKSFGLVRVSVRGLATAQRSRQTLALEDFDPVLLVLTVVFRKKT